MNLLILLLILSFFFAIICWARYAEYAEKRKVIVALRHHRCPGCGRPLEPVKLEPIGGMRRICVGSYPNSASFGMWRFECRKCGKVLSCDSGRAGIRLH